MVKEIEITFDFKNSKEYYLKYFPYEFTETEKIPENLRDKKFYRFERSITAKPLGTFLLEFLNLDFTDIWALNYFLVHYSLVSFMTYSFPNVFLESEFYRDRILGYNERNNLELILTEPEIIYHSERVKALYRNDITAAQSVFRDIIDNKLFKTLYENSTPEDADYEQLKTLKENESYESVLYDFSKNFKDIKTNFDIYTFFSNNIPNDAKGNIDQYFYSGDFGCILFITLKEFIRNIKNFRIVKCQNCDSYFIPKTGHKTLYCDEIFEDGKTCKEYAESLAFSRKLANDPVCKHYRNRYKNLQKQASNSNTPDSRNLYERYKLEGAQMLDNYQKGKINAEEFENWINSMRIRKE